MREVYSIRNLDRGIVIFEFKDGWMQEADKWAKKHNTPLTTYYIQQYVTGNVICSYVVKEENDEQPTKN